MDLRTRLALMFLAAATLVGLGNFLLYRSNARLAEDMRWVMHTYSVREEISGVELATRDMRAAIRDLILTGRDKAVSEYFDAREQLHVGLQRVAELARDNPVQNENARKLAELAGLRRESMDRLFHEQQSDAKSAQSLLNQGQDREALVDFGTLVRSMREIETGLLAQRESAARQSAALNRLMLSLAAGMAIALLGLCFVLVWREQRRRQINEARLSEAAVALEAALAESRHLSDALRQLGEMNEMLQSCQSVSEAYAVASSALPGLLQDCGGALQMINASQNLVETVAEWGQPALARENLFPPEDCLAVRRGQAYPPAEARTSLRCRHVHEAGDGEASYLCVPLSAQGSAFGILHISCNTPIDTMLRRDCIAAAEQLSLALANLRLQDSLRTQSIRDPLTGLFNRRYLEASLPRELQRAERREHGLAVLMLDIDHFKRFNDTHGHDAGDALLAQVGAVLAQATRAEDIACRYGGEEFTVVLPDTHSSQALARAETLRLAIAAIDVSHRRVQLGRVTCSIGLACYPEHGRTPADLIARADRALYAAKEAGRDQVRVAEPRAGQLLEAAHTPA